MRLNDIEISFETRGNEGKIEHHGRGERQKKIKKFSFNLFFELN